MAGPGPGVAYSVTVRCEYPNNPGMLGKITSAIGEAGGDVSAVDVVSTSGGNMVRDFTINTRGLDHGQVVIDHVKAVPDVTIGAVSDPTFLLHIGGKIEMRSKTPVTTRDDMSKAYTPGVGRVCSEKVPSASATRIAGRVRLAGELRAEAGRGHRHRGAARGAATVVELDARGRTFTHYSVHVEIGSSAA